jgi:hypothetical protein
MAIEVSIVANLVSAFLGSVVIIVFEIAFAKAGFEAYYGWLAKIPFYVALPPTYFLTVWLEALIALPIIRTKTYRNLVRDFYVVNIYSYAVLAIAGLLITQGPY